jgi:hypothetical protein
MKRELKTSLALEHLRSMSRWARTPTLLEGHRPPLQFASSSFLITDHCPLPTLLFLFPEN